MKKTTFFYGIAITLSLTHISCQHSNDPYIRYPQVNSPSGGGGYQAPSGSTYEVKKPNRYYWGDTGSEKPGSRSSSRKTKERKNYYMGDSDQD